MTHLSRPGLRLRWSAGCDGPPRAPPAAPGRRPRPAARSREAAREALPGPGSIGPVDASRAEQPPRAQRALRGAAVLAASLALGGCTFVNPQTTQEPYVVSDGQGVSLGEVRVASLLVVAEEEGQPGRLVARIVNGTPDEQRVTITGEGLDETVTAPPQETVAIGEPGDEDAVDIIIDAVSRRPGQLVELTLVREGGETLEVGVPVLDGSLEQYAPYLPTAEPTGGAAPTPGGGGTGAPETPAPGGDAPSVDDDEETESGTSSGTSGTAGEQ